MKKVSLILVILMTISSSICGQTHGYETIQNAINSGIFLDNVRGELSSVFESTIEIENAIAIRLAITSINLGNNSFLRIKSVKENRYCDFTEDMLERWDYTTPFFNGNKIELSLFHHPDDMEVPRLSRTTSRQRMQ